MDSIGIYVHVPFCSGKCPYCDFYSICGNAEAMDAYTDAMVRVLHLWRRSIHPPVDTVYFGGGTPVLLGASRLNRILTAIRLFNCDPDAEITIEANPAAAQETLFQELHEIGFNRMSLGLQSANPAELRFLGRRHTVEQAEAAFYSARTAGFDRISLDLMLGLQGQTIASLRRSIDFCAGLGADHVSAYLLKVEPGTPFAAQADKLNLPDEDEQAAFYHETCAALRSHGYEQYEISNFARPGFASRHNLKYWHDEPYLGIGPGAHSFLDGRRFYYSRDLNAFCAGAEPIPDGSGGDAEEYAMLALRLTEGLREESYRARFGRPIPEKLRVKAQPLARAGLVRVTGEAVSLTEEGFLLSNAVIGELLTAFDPVTFPTKTENPIGIL